MAKPKDQTWAGYFDSYLRAAKDQGIPVAESLDGPWADSRSLVERCVLPYLNPSAVVLEIACGVGRMSRFVAPHCQELVCSDILDSALEACAETMGGAANVSFVKTNGYDLALLEDASFDCVYSFTAFFHFDWEVVVGYFAEIKRVLKPGGTAVLEFKQWKKSADVDQLLEKIQSCGGVAGYEAELDKWRYVSPEMLDLLCEYYELKPIDRDATRYTFRKL